VKEEEPQVQRSTLQRDDASVDRGDNEMTITNKSIAVIAIVAALALFGVVAVTAATLTIQLQQADAARPVGAGCSATSPAANASKTRCFNG
jgi:hypothetical protein